MYPRLGVPHFQRGLVWTPESLSMLLESLYFGTPCGNVILWRPRVPSAQGISLTRDGSGFDLLILDGQQRIRSLQALFKGGGDSGEAVEDDGGEEPADDDRVWCMDMTVEPSFAGLCDRQEKRRSLFVHALDPRKPRKPQRTNILPLESLMAEGSFSEACRSLLHVKASPEDVDRRLDAVRVRARSMLASPLFSVIELVETDAEHTLGDVVQLYNRINSGGRRVEAEEKAFATLVRLAPSVNDHVRAFFAEIHGSADASDLEQRDDMLRRRKESRFGFKLYIRTFAQICNYHFGRSCGTAGFSFDILDSPQLHAEFANPGSAKKVDALFTETTRILSAMRRVLREVLYCDDLRMLADTGFFPPVVHLMARYPALASAEHDKAIGYLILKLASGWEYTQPKFLSLVRLVEKSHNAAECIRSIALKLGKSKGVGEEIDKCLRWANSLNSRHVLLLYWLIRRNGARDLSYGNLPGTHRLSRMVGKEPLIDASLAPEKQHLVPASLAGRILGAASRIKTSSHEANNVGNLTYISHDLNCLEGLGDVWVDPGRESSDENLRAHYLHPEQIGDTFELMVRDRTKCTKSTFGEFCRRRRVAMAEGFERWLVELEPFFRVEERLRPARCHFVTHLADRVRELGYPDDVEDALLCSIGSLKPKKSKHVSLVLTVKHRRDEPAILLVFLSDPVKRIEIEHRETHRLAKAIGDCMQAHGFDAPDECPYCRQRHQPKRWLVPAEDGRAASCLRAIAAILKPSTATSP